MSRSQPCAFCGLPPDSTSYLMPELEVRDSQGNLLERQGTGPWPVCRACALFVDAHDDLGLSHRVAPLLANRAGHPLSAAAEEHVNARHRAFFAALPRQRQQGASAR